MAICLVSKEFHNSAKKAGSSLFSDARFMWQKDRLHDKSGKEDRSGDHLILLAKNLTGYKNLIKLVSVAWIKGFYYKPRIDKELLSTVQ